LKQWQQVAVAVALAALQHNKQHKAMTAAVDSDSSIEKMQSLQ